MAAPRVEVDLFNGAQAMPVSRQDNRVAGNLGCGFGFSIDSSSDYLFGLIGNSVAAA